MFISDFKKNTLPKVSTETCTNRNVRIIFLKIWHHPRNTQIWMSYTIQTPSSSRLKDNKSCSKDKNILLTQKHPKKMSSNKSGSCWRRWDSSTTKQQLFILHSNWLRFPFSSKTKIILKIKIWNSGWPTKMEGFWQDISEVYSECRPQLEGDI